MRYKVPFGSHSRLVGGSWLWLLTAGGRGSSLETREVGTRLGDGTSIHLLVPTGYTKVGTRYWYGGTCRREVPVLACTGTADAVIIGTQMPIGDSLSTRQARYLNVACT